MYEYIGLIEDDVQEDYCRDEESDGGNESETRGRQDEGVTCGKEGRILGNSQEDPQISTVEHQAEAAAAVGQFENCEAHRGKHRANTCGKVGKGNLASETSSAAKGVLADEGECGRMGGRGEGEEGERGNPAAPASCRGKFETSHELGCSICSQPFSATVEESQPVQLRCEKKCDEKCIRWCKHTFCRTCVKNWRTSGKRVGGYIPKKSCPHCRKIYTKRKFPINQDIINLIIEMGKESLEASCIKTFGGLSSRKQS